MSSTDNTIQPTSERPRTDQPGILRLYRFDNGYGASVITFEPEYGVIAEGRWELGVMRYDDADQRGRMVYDTPIGNAVIGNLSDDDLQAVLARIRDLPPCKPLPPAVIARVQAGMTRYLATGRMLQPSEITHAMNFPPKDATCPR